MHCVIVPMCQRATMSLCQCIIVPLTLCHCGTASLSLWGDKHWKHLKPAGGGLPGEPRRLVAVMTPFFGRIAATKLVAPFQLPGAGFSNYSAESGEVWRIGWGSVQ